MTEIALNFLTVSNSEFYFDVWSRPITDASEKRPSEHIRRYKLPSEKGEYKYYWVSFDKFENSELKRTHSKDNIYLTNCYLFTLLKQKIEEVKLNYKQKENEKNFSPYHLYIVVEETDWGDRSIRFEPYYLKINNVFGFLVDYKFLKHPEKTFNREIQKLSFSLDENYRSNTGFHVDKYRYISGFLKKYLPKFSKIRNDLEILNEFQKIECKKLKLRKYIFKNGKEDNSQFQGINNYGPYEWVNKEIHYVYIYHEDHKDYANYLLKALNGDTFKTFEGLEKLGLPSQIKGNTRGVPIKSFEEDLENYLINVEQNSVIIAIFPANEKKFYYKLKNICLQRDIPLQMVHLETITDENKLKWSLSGIALQILAKSGGIPWLVKAENQNCLIVGVGQSIERGNIIRRYFAYSVLIDSSGKFLAIEPLALATNKNEYFSEVGRRISEIIKNYPRYKKIVFHIPEKISKVVIEKIENVLKDIRSDIEFYILKVNDDSKFFGYDMNNNSLIPYESSYIQLSSKEFLLWTEGLNYHNPTPRKRYSNPIYIDFYYSNQKSINYISFLQDILNLSGTNYRGFNAKSLPVSIFYPKLISNFHKFFNKYNLHFKIKRSDKMWFL